MQPLGGKVVIVTGAGSGIGRCTAAMAASAGARVIAVDRKGADESAASITGDGGDAVGYTLDVGDMTGWEAMAKAIVQSHGRIDALVNAAGVAAGEDSILSQTEAGWDQVMRVNLRGPWFGMRAVLPHMLEAGAGRIVNISSVAGVVGMPSSFAYATSKAGLIGMTRQVAVEFASQGIRINAIAPGIIETPMLGDGAEESVSAMKKMTPARRIGAPNEIAGMIGYLIGPTGDFATGQVFIVDGGWTAQ